MIEYIITNPSFFINSMKAISSIIYEGFLLFDKTIIVSGMGASRIVFFELTIGEDLLLIKKGGHVKVPLDFSDLAKILKRFKSGKISTLSLLYDDNVLTIKGKIDNNSKTFKLRTKDIDYEDLSLSKLLQLPLDAIFKINTFDLLDALKDCEIYSETFCIKTAENNVIIYETGNIGEVEVKLQPITEIYSDQTAAYKISFVRDILESTSNPEILLMFRKDYPLGIHDKLSDTSKMIWYIAPRVENDD